MRTSLFAAVFGTEYIGYGLIVAASIIVLINSVISYIKHSRFKREGEKLSALIEKGAGSQKSSLQNWRHFNCRIGTGEDEKTVPVRVLISEPAYKELTGGEGEPVSAEVYFQPELSDEAYSADYLKRRLRQSMSNILFFLLLTLFVSYYFVLEAQG